MSDDEKRRKLVEFLDRHAFDPILSKSPDDFPDDKKKKFQDLKRSTESEKNRFHNNYRSATDVKNNYLSDLNSKTAKKKNSELEELGLPQLPEFRDQFMHLCEELHV